MLQKEIHDTIREIIVRNGYVDELELVDTLEDNGISKWQYDKVKISFRQKFAKAGITYNKKLKVYHVGPCFSLSLFSVPNNVTDMTLGDAWRKK